MRQTSTYKTVDELPNLLDKAKQPEFKSVDDLPDLKKKSFRGWIKRAFGWRLKWYNIHD